MRFKSLLLALVLSLTFAAGACAATPTITVPAGAADDAGSTAGCTAGATSGSYTCKTPRDAVALANSLGGDPTIDLGAGTFDLTNGPLAPTVDMTISGAGDQGGAVTTITPAQIEPDDDLTLTGLVLDGDGTVCGVVGGASALTLDGVTVTGGRCAGGPGEGAGSAAIYTPDVLTLTDSVVSHNTAMGGDGSAAAGSNAAVVGGPATAVIGVGGLVMSGSVVSDNTATSGSGGAGSTSQPAEQGGVVEGAGIELYSSGGQPSSITSSLITDNMGRGGAGGSSSGATSAGGAGSVLGAGLFLVDNSSPFTVTITDTTFSGNVAQGGGAVSNTATGGSGGNANYAGGGGLYAMGSVALDISGSTFSANQAIVQNGGDGAGGETGYAGSAEGAGLYLNEGPTATIVNTTIADNVARSGTGSGTTGTIGSFGGGIDAYGATRVGLYNDTISGNSVAAALGASAEIGANLLSISSPFTLTDTVLANALPAGAPNCATQSSGSFTDGGYNLEDDSLGTCGLNGAAHDQLGPSGLLAVPYANGAVAPGAPAPAATATTPAIPALATLAPAAGSLLIGHGGACVNPLASGSPALSTDERGDPRPGSCDIGAFQTQPLTVSGAPAITGTPAVGQTLTCATGSLAARGDGVRDSTTGALGAPALSYVWTRGQTVLASTPTYTVTAGDQGGSISCAVTATGAYGQGEGVSPAMLIPAASAGIGGTGGLTGTASTTARTRLTLTDLHQKHATWSERRLKHGPPHDTTFTYSLNVAATVHLSFARISTGRTVAGKCVALTRKNRRRRSCVLSRLVATLTHVSHPGTTTLGFSGRIGRRRLAPGTYTLTVTATTTGGSVVAPRKLRFRIEG